MDVVKVGKSIAFLRKHYGMTQEELAQKVGVSFKTVSKWENGRGIPDISMISKIAAILDIDVESLLEGNISQYNNEWVGVLYLDYAGGVFPDEIISTLRIVEFQISFFMLAGIRKIYLIGSTDYVNRAKSCFSPERSIGIELIDTNDIIDFENFELSAQGIMLITQLSFLYGKDVTRYFRRIMYDEKVSVKLVNYQNVENGICFISGKARGADLKNISYRPYSLERGVISFPLNDGEDLLDAAVLIRLLEKHNGEKIANLEDIARIRNL